MYSVSVNIVMFNRNFNVFRVRKATFAAGKAESVAKIQGDIMQSELPGTGKFPYLREIVTFTRS